MSNTQTADIGLGQTILRRAAITPNARALTFEGQTWTCAELGERVRRLASVLRDGGIKAGDRVGYIGLNHPVFLETLYACGCLGAIFVPLNFRLTGPEVRFIANDAGISTMLADDMLRPLIDEEKENLHCSRFITIETDADNWEPLAPLMAAADPIAASEKVAVDDVAFIMYTSGTTGLPKGAMLTHGNIFWNSINVCFGEDTMDSTTLTCAPLFHIGGLNVTTLLSLAKGIEVVLLRAFDAGQVLALIEEHKISTMFGAPTMFLMMAQHENFASTDLSSISTLTCGGAPVPVPLIKTYGERGVNFCQGYGLTETAPFASLLASDLAMVKVGSAGKAPMFTQVRIVDGDNNPVAAGVHGEVCIKGPNVMKGYWNREDATAEAIDDQGWFHSGDIGYLDDEDFLFLCDRVKDMVITGGENVYPAEVESVLYGHKSVLEVAVIGLPDDKWGEAVTAVVVLEEGAELSLEELRDFAGESLARYKLPSRLHFMDLLPRNPAGKVQKFKINEQLGL
ncbi:MAG: long-chain fatty acid--CoA ligase [Porticoccaceae bacterium]|nr:long-chain fatty acid--CoA ligase [Porticoccaceae bacterium]MBT5577628.1 long-chain fatty acid--CoA ligase [Porticoccaceae bacterium]